MTFRRVFRAAIVALALPVAVSAQTAARIVVSPMPAQVVAGETLQLRAQAVDKDGKPVSDARIRFQQTDFPFQGTVDSTGLVRAGSVSTIPVVVSAIQPGVKPIIAKLDVSVIAGPAASITIAPATARLVPRQTMLASAQVFSKSGDLRRDVVAWTSAAPAVAKVDPSGTITAVGAGRTTITATVGSVVHTMIIDVVGTPVKSIALTPSRPSARTGDVIHLKAVAKDAAGREIAGITPTWSFSPGQGQLDADGTFVGYEPGTYTVTALVGASVAQTTITLVARDVRRPATVVGSVVRSAFATSEVWVHPNGKIAYLGTLLGGDRVYVIDIADPSKPTIVDSVVVNARTINDIMTSEDGKVMVITREGADNRKNGIVVATLEDPLHPKVVGEFTDGVTAGVHSAYIYTQPKFGTHVYLTNDGTGALHIIDINDPAHPKQVATWKTPSSDAGRMLRPGQVGRAGQIANADIAGMRQSVQLRGQTPQPRVRNNIFDRSAPRRRHRQNDLPILHPQPVIADFSDRRNPQPPPGRQQRNLSRFTKFQHQFRRLRLIAPDVQTRRTPGNRCHQRRQASQTTAFR